MPKTAFPLGKTSFKVPASYGWRVVRFESCGEYFRLLIFYRPDLEVFNAWLGLEAGIDMLLMARFEFHGTHPGWHMHCLCDSTGAVAGRTGGCDKRIPKPREFHKQSGFGVTNDRLAFDLAVKAFKLDKKPNMPFELT